MVYRRRRARRPIYRKKTYTRRKAPMRIYKKRVPRSIAWKNPIPSQGLYKFVYHDSGFAFAPTAGNAFKVLKQFRGNSLFDPDYTGVGVQPYGYDNLCGANCSFGKYLVYASKITVYPHVFNVTDLPTGTTGAWNIKVLLWPSQNVTTTYKDFEDVMRMPYAKMRCIENADDAGGNNILTRYVSTRKMWPGSKGLQEVDFSAAYNANPLNEWFWNIQADSTGFALPCSIYMDIKIKYYCRLIKTDSVNES